MKKTKDKIYLNKLRHTFYKKLENGNLGPLPDTIRKMRKITGLAQPEYARLVGVSPRVLIDLERGVGNPTLKTLEKIISPFGLRIGLTKKSQSITPVKKTVSLGKQIFADTRG